MTDPIGTMIRRARRDRGLTQAATAAELQVHTMTLRRWELGHAVPALRYRRDLAAWLDCSLEDVTSACLEAVAAEGGSDV